MRKILYWGEIEFIRRNLLKRFWLFVAVVLVFACLPAFAQEREAPVNLDMPVNYSDSADYYNHLAEDLDFVAETKWKSGLGMMGIGVVGAGIGVTMLAKFIVDNDAYFDDGSINRDGLLLSVPGTALAGGGLALVTIGVVKLVSSSNYSDKAYQRRLKANEFSGKENGAKVSLMPEINPFGKSLGVQLSLNI